MTASFNPAAFRAILIGAESLTIACGDMLLAGGHEVVSVVSHDPAVRAWAEEKGLPLLESPKELQGSGVAADWLLSIANLRLLSDDVLALPKKGAINFHDGPLPDYAGLNTPAWALLRGEREHGVTWHLIEGGIDEGDILATQSIAIQESETAFSLNSKCYAAGMESFAAVLSQLETGRLDRHPQDLAKRRYFARDDRPEGKGFLDFTRTGQELLTLFRALDFGDYWNPLALPKVILRDRILHVGRMTEANEPSGKAGEVIRVEADRILVGTASAPLWLSALSPLEGPEIVLADLASTGDLLVCPDTTGIAAVDEGHWHSLLLKSEALPLPLAMTRTETGFETLPLDLPQGTAQDEALAAAALSLLQGAGCGSGLVALGQREVPLGMSHWVPLRLAAEAEMAFEDLAESITTQIEGAEKRASFPIDLLKRDPALRDRSVPQIGVAFEADHLAGTSITLCLTQGGATLSYDRARLSDEAAQILRDRLDAAFTALSGAETCGPFLSLSEVEQERLDGWNATEKPFLRQTVHAFFEEQVARTPEAVALVFEAQSFTYAELNARANKIAMRLREMGAKPGVSVGLCLKRGPGLLVGALGILKAGAAYVPIDPAYPADRIAHYLADSQAPILITEGSLEGSLPAHDAQVLLLEPSDLDGPAETANPDPLAGPDDLAYLIYTSGSTGKPKGVMVSHANVSNFFVGMDDCVTHEEGAVWLAVTSLSFDISVLELFWTLARGFKVVLAGDESRTMVSGGPLGMAAKRMDFNLMYWGNDDGVGPKKYELLLEGAKFADAHGFNAVWTPERHFHAFGGPYPNPSVTGAAVAAVTSNLAVRAGSCVAPLHHPARIAEEWAVIDNLTNGRIGLAIASGWQPDDFVLRPENTPPQNKPAMYSAIEQLRALWAGEAVEFPKGDGTLHAVVTQPRPVSTRLPIWVTTAGNPETWREAGEIGANVLTHLLGQSIDEVAAKIKIYHAALRDAGHDPADFTVTLMLHSFLADTRAEAEEIAREPMKDYLRAAAGLIKQYAWAFPAFKRPEGTTNAFDLDLEGLSDEELEAILEFAFQRYFNDSGLFGTVEDGLARVEALRQIGVDEIACLIDYGIAPAGVLEGLRPLAQVLEKANHTGGPAEYDFSLAAQIVRHGVTHLQCTPSMAQMLVTNEEARQALGRLSHVLLGGEALPGSLVHALREVTQADLLNMYGPTETTIWSSTYGIAEEVGAVAPIGTPIANTQLFILDEKMQRQAIGIEGELWIGGEGVTPGYWRREETTAQAFRANPFGPGKIYKTGDLARFNAAGELLFAGRADAQVKIRGHRIELGEIEAELTRLPAVRQAVAKVVEMPGGAQLAAYLQTGPDFDEKAAREALQDRLPAIMLPSHYVLMEAMPLTPNKKIDRKALPLPKLRQERQTAAAPDRNATQRAIADVWKALLGLADVRADDNFFALGGHSLLAVQAHRDIRAKLGAESLSITDIFRFPVLDVLAAHLDSSGKTTATAATVAPTEGPAKSETMSRRRAMRAGRSKAGA